MTPQLTVLAHELVAIDAAAQRCSCGDSSTSHLEHLAEIVLAELAPNAAPELKVAA